MTAVREYHYGSWQGHILPTTISSTNMNSSTVALGWVMEAGTTDAITKCAVRWSSRTGTPPTYIVGIEGVDASGQPDGTYKGGGSPASVTLTPPASTAWNATIQEFTFTNSWTPSASSDLIAITLRHSSGTVDGSNFSQVSHGVTGYFAGAIRSRPYLLTGTGGVWTKSTSHSPIVAIGTASSWFGSPLLSIYTTATANTAGHRSAMYFTKPAGLGTTFTVEGVSLNAKLADAAGSCYLRIWDTSNNVLATATIDGDQLGSPGNSGSGTYHFASPVTLSYGTKYRVGIEVISATVAISGISVGAAGRMAVFPDGEVSGLATWDGSTWTETATIMPLCSLVVTDHTGSSGGLSIIGQHGQTGIGVY